MVYSISINLKRNYNNSSQVFVFKRRRTFTFTILRFNASKNINDINENGFFYHLHKNVQRVKDFIKA